MNRRAVLLAAPAMAALAACQQGPKTYAMQVSRDTGCTCCSAWVEELGKSGRFQITMFDAGDLPEFKRSVGVPPGLGSCHTALVERYVIEGHVPEADILRLLAEKPKGILGLAVAGMPRGAPGMAQPNGAKDPFTVYAFDANKTKIEYAAYPGDA